MHDIYTIDFETYYDAKYSLFRMTTEEYLRDERFEIIGVSVAKNNEDPEWFSSSSLLDYRKKLAYLEGKFCCAHNAMFDMAILEWHLGIQPMAYFDTLSMARPWHGAHVGGSLKALAEYYELGEKGTAVLDAKGKRLHHFSAMDLALYGDYCDQDVRLTVQLLDILLRKTTAEELKLIQRTLMMFTRPKLELDVDMLYEDLNRIKVEKADAILRSGTNKTTLMSNPKLAKKLEALGVDVPMKPSPRNPDTETFAFAKSDKGFTDLLEYPDPKVRNMVAARLIVKSTLQETRIQTFLDIASRGKLPVPLLYCGANTTWRWSGTDDVNLQNLPHAGVLRHAIRAPAGYVIVVVDSSNIELRVNHTLAGQEFTIRMLREGADLYCQFASELYGREITKEDEAERFVGKVAHLSLGYNCGWQRFQDMARQKGITLTDNEAQDIVNLWRRTYWKIPELWKDGQRALDAMDTWGEYEFGTLGLRTEDLKIITPPNHFIEYPELTRNGREFVYKQRKGRAKLDTKIYGGKVCENICQHLARNIIGEQWNRIKYPVVMQAHDELVMCVKEAHADQCLADAIGEMSESPAWWPEIPLAAEGGIGDTYGQAK